MSKQLEILPQDVELFEHTQELKKCTSCHRDLPLSCYKAVGGSRRVDGTPKLRNKCDSCYTQNQKQRASLLKITPRPDDNYKCPICLNTKGQFYEDTNDTTRQGFNNSWCLDHDHTTGKFRGWLCNKCNSALGWFDDNVDRMRRAVKYMEEHSA